MVRVIFFPFEDAAFDGGCFPLRVIEALFFWSHFFFFLDFFSLIKNYIIDMVNIATVDKRKLITYI